MEKRKYDQLKEKIETILPVLEESAEEHQEDVLVSTYLELSVVQREKMLKGLKEMIKNPKSVEKNREIIPLKLVMLIPQMREIQLLINDVVNK